MEEPKLWCYGWWTTNEVELISLTGKTSDKLNEAVKMVEGRYE